ncbi:DUF1344 domain-containing protein [Rhodovulum marinum]|uniref:Uncharacterized protein DUF1344 n=1 Tax=Rhodovulum marinum TaxID=320662 RepID=A0A4R2Q099_9RHOB|nr:DUF1344 domain-containing protein [Rhodovulum marinum]TCP40025.1 uncharacterized protein DUF1344 [Rhodovulum marinum]
MQTKLVPLTLVALISASSAALAEHSIGYVQSVDQGSNTLTLSDGSSYTFNRNNTQSPLSGLTHGDTVDVLWQHVGGGREGRAISPVSGLQAVGTLQSADPAGNSVTLTDGRMFHFPDSTDTNTVLASLKPGDVVHIAFHDGSGRLLGDSIGTTGADHATGTIASVTNDTVTLSDGSSYSFADTHGAHDKLADFKAGDRVDILWVQSGDSRTGASISPANG